MARRTHRRNNSNDSNASNNNSPKSSNSIKSPVWGRSALTSASSPLTSISPSPSAFASASNSNSSSSSLSPRMWSRSKSKGIPTDNNTASSNNIRSLSPPQQHHRPQHSFDNDNSIYNLATISENRRISSNTLNKITIKTPVSQLTKQLTESERSAQAQQQQQQQQVRVREIKANNNPYENENDDEDCELCGCGRGGGGGCLSILNPKTYRNFFDRNSISIYSSGRRSRSRKKQWKKTHH